jgi:hypothetical protein
MRRARGLLRDDSAQAIVLVGLFLSALMALLGLAVDIAWYQINVDRMQRAADAGALAGVVYLPGNIAQAQTAALNEAKKNGYENGIGGVTVTAAPEPANDKIINVRVTAPVQTWFARLVGVNQFSGSRNARAEFVLPVPMGSPQDYYGINVVCANSDTPPNCPQVPSAVPPGNLAPLGFFGGVEAKGTERQNGDAYSTYYNGNPTLNAGYDVRGYSYVVDFPSGTVDGKVWLYDPMFCATGGNTSTGRRLGVGDFWLGNGGVPIRTDYNLWDMNGTPYDQTDDILLASKSYTSKDVDKSASYRGNQQYGAGYDGSGSSDCANNAAHNKWVLLNPTALLAPGQYRLQVVTSNGTTSENAVNGFGIQVSSTSGPSARVYGQSRMCAFIVINNTSIFYLAQVEAAHAGKTLEIKLFDPGDISNTTFRILMPTAVGYSYATFSWTATGSSCGAPTSGTNVTSLPTSSGSCNYYNNQWVTISAAIPASYGSGGVAPQPPGEPGPGWWKIEYGTLGTGQDITTWEVNIRGNPVHLIVP